MGGDATALSPFAELGAQSATIRALARLGIETPTPIQAQAIPPLLAGRDVIGQSRTGSGKTIAFGLPLVERINPRQRVAQALVLVPTRELATQVAEALASLDGGRGLRIAQLVGGRPFGLQRQALFAGAQIVVGAPGRVLDHIRQGTLNLQNIRMVVLDEADQMLDEGFAPDIERILAQTPETRQLALFSATLPAWTVRLANRYVHDPAQVEAGAGEVRPTSSSIAQVVYTLPYGQRLNALVALLERRRDATGATLIFGRTKHGVKKLANQLTERGYPVAALQGNMSQNARDRVVADFRAGRTPTLLATNIAARGLDVMAIDQVINYELPESAELFTHRIGRTGRMDRTGEAITLLTPEDTLAWRKLQRELSGRLQPQPWPHGEMPLPELREQKGAGVAVVAPAEPNTLAQRPEPSHDDRSQRAPTHPYRARSEDARTRTSSRYGHSPRADTRMRPRSDEAERGAPRRAAYRPARDPQRGIERPMRRAGRRTAW